MLLTVDIGNTSTFLGVFDGDRIVADWRISTKGSRTLDECGIILTDLFNNSGFNLESISGVVVSSVVPHLKGAFTGAIKKYMKIDPLFIAPGVKTGMPILSDNPREVGADRIVNGVAAYEKFKREVIVVDFGTATTFDYISAKGEYMGGAIVPGIKVSLEALFHRASKLPRVDVIKPERVVGKDTISSMQSGIFFGYVSLVEGMVAKMKKEVGGNPSIVGTGGLATLISSGTNVIEKVEPHLTLQGLKIIYERNRQ